MKIFFNILKVSGMLIGGFIVLLVVTTILFVNKSPQFGGTPTEEQRLRYARSGHYTDGKFVNTLPTTLDLGFRNTLSVMYEYFFSNIPNRQPAGPLPMEKIDSIDIVNKPDSLTRITWFGHSACLLETAGKNLLLDPMLGPSPSPHPLVGTKRYNKELPIAIDQLPHIDAVVISHDHYDHLDYESILKLKDKVSHFYVPLGVGTHLLAWGVDATRITELNWWEKTQHGSFTFICTPARHFSGRKPFNNFTTLWSSWVIKAEHRTFYFSGDSGYGPHFKEIGDAYGPFDFAMIECGQYNPLWATIHMMPEETVQAALDVRGKLLMPIHWGAFSLAMHSWTDPIERVTVAAHQMRQPITTPKIGEPIILTPTSPIPNAVWWK